MLEQKPIAKERIDQLVAKLSNQIKNRGYFLNPDKSFTESLAEGLLINEDRYGYQNCPCRLASGKKEEDLDIICPCDYRDADVSQFGNCFCALYVSKDVSEGKKPILPVPERRPSKELRIKLKQMNDEKREAGKMELSHPVWRCGVCGYLCSRDEAPDICPICGAPKERFEKFLE